MSRSSRHAVWCHFYCPVRTLWAGRFIELTYDTIEIGAMIRKVVQGLVDETELARWLRDRIP